MGLNGCNTDEVVNRINNDINHLVFRDTADSSPQSLACFCCEKSMMNEKGINMKIETIKKIRELFVPCEVDELSTELIEDYRYKGVGRKVWMKGMLISKYACYSRHDKSFLTCRACHVNLHKKKYPVYGIRNGFYTGYAPTELEELNDVELSFICPVRLSGHIFTYFGGAKGIKGWHSLLKCDMKSTFRSLHGMERLDLPNRIAIVLAGPMSVRQKDHVKKKSIIRRDKCMAAVQKLIAINKMSEKEFADFDFDSIPDPILIDRTSNLDADIDTNVELSEEFTLVFPDSSLNDTYGGYRTVKEFKMVVEEVNKVGYNNLTLLSTASEYAADYEDDNFVKAFPKQFPHGRGGPKERREKNDNELFNMPLTDYLVHVNGLVNPNFHTQMFSVVSYNMLQRQNMVQRACWKLKSSDQVATKIATVTDQEIKERVVTKKHRLTTGTLAAVEFIDLVDVITGSLPHSNKAAKSARSDGLAMQVEFGSPAVFLTVTPDDSNSYIIQIYSGFEMDRNRSVNDMNPDEIASLAKEKNTLRITYPGMCTLWFESVLDIVMKHIVGWDMKKNEATEEGGYCGIAEAVFAAIEEQSRKCLHAHIIMYLKKYNALLKKLQSMRKQTVDNAAMELVKLQNKLGSNVLVDQPVPEMFVHSAECISKKLPVIVSHQQLRELRHKEGSRMLGGVIATCGECGGQWSSEEIAFAYVKGMAVEGGVLAGALEKMANEGRTSMKELMHLVSGLKTNLNRFEHELLTNCIYNLHGSQHVKQCFKNDCECRFHHPRLPMGETELVCVSTLANWSNWNGTTSVYKQYEIECKRNDFDVFMNQYCPVVSQSKIASNSNVRLLTDGRAGFYATSYTAKPTQDEDESDYKRVLDFTQKRLYEARYESEFSESLSRLLGASFAHSSSNVISPWLAKYLIRNGSRFYISHKTVIVPCFALEDELNGAVGKNVYVKCHGQNQFLDSVPQQYMYRPGDLEKYSPVEFFIKFNAVRRHESTENQLYVYTDENYPGTGYMGVKESNEENRIPRFHTNFIPDASTFKSNLLTAHGDEINLAMEVYARRVMILYSSYRTLDDLMHDGSYVQRFQKWVECDGLTEKIKTALHNLQEMKNTNKLSRKPDLLEVDTHPYKSNKKEKNKKDDEDDDMVPIEFMQSLVTEYIDGGCRVTLAAGQERTLNVSEIMQRGKDCCGLRNVASTVSSPKDSTVFIEQETESSPVPTRIQPGLRTYQNRECISAENAVKLIGMRVERVVKNHAGTCAGEKRVDVTANGTVESIVKWCRYMVEFDEDQQRAFEILAGQFVLSYFDEAVQHTEAGSGRQTRGTFPKEKRKLRAMVGKYQQVIMFLTGPGGSGKSEVVKQLLLYAIDFCKNLGVAFDDRTILVTAMSGVAATLINGETLHSAVHLNFNLSNLTEEMMEAFANVRFLLIDEISFANSDDVRKLDRVLRVLRQCQDQKYGGMNIAFMGDFSQIPSVTGPRLYEDVNCNQWHKWINCFIQLKGRWRFKDDPAFGETCWRFHEGTPTPDDFEKINARLLTTLQSKGVHLPDGISYAVHFNKDRDAINTATYIKHLETKGTDGCLLVLASEVKVVSKQEGEKPMKDTSMFWSRCGESDTKTLSTRSRLDPVLKLYPGCPLMHMANTNVKAGEANGTQAIAESVMLKASADVFNVEFNGHTVKAVLAHEVAHIKVKLLLGDHCPVKNIKGTDYSFICNYPIPDEFSFDKKERQKIKMKAVQFPLVSNTATTGHKLQGATRDMLYIPYWFYGVPNWPYVMISRVRKITGLYIGKCLDPNRDYSLDSRIVRMLKSFEQYTPDPFDPPDY